MIRLQQDSINLGQSAFFQGGLITQLSERLVREFHRMDTAASLIIEGLTLEIMAETARHSSKKIEQTIPRWLKQAKDLLHARFTENLTLGQIALEAGFANQGHFSSTFKRLTGLTPAAYRNSLHKS